jgi:nucleoside-diphosphate-sugar epimerase
MKILLIGGKSSTAQALIPVLSQFADVITAGRAECDVYFDFNVSIEKIIFPDAIDVVVNIAADFGGKNYEQIYSTENTNVLGALKLCQICLDAKVKHLIHISSIYIYLKEKSPYYGIYSLSKKHSDELISLFCNLFNLSFTILRPSQLYGSDDSFRKHQPFFYTIIDNVEQNRDVVIYGKNDALRNYLNIDDFVKIISLVISNKVEGLYSCTNQNDVSLSDIAQLAIDSFHSSSKIVFATEKNDIPDNIFPYDDSLYQIIKYTPETSMKNGLQKIANYRLKKL